VDAIYRASGNVLIDRLLGATLHSFPTGEDEEGADRRLHEIAGELARQGRRPYVIPLGPGNPPTGALGYVRCAEEILGQSRDFDAVVIASGSGHTHAGLLFGLRALGWAGPVHGICVRRPAPLQQPRIADHCAGIAALLGLPNPVTAADIDVYDDVLA